MAAPETKCCRCGAALNAGALEGFCQRCLALVAFGAEGQTETASAPAPTLGHLGSYELLEEIGRGGMGVVYRARQLGLDREVALKVLRHGPFADASDVARFRREAAAAAGLRHPNIVAVHEVGEADGHVFFSMDLVRGPTLAELVRDGPMEPIRAAGCARVIADAVAAAHSQGILHRDLKPSNVIIDADNQPRLTDFGLARRFGGAETTHTQHGAGTPGYMAPEQANLGRGDVAAASDIYSLGALLYHLLTGRPPFQGETLSAILLQVQNTDPIAPRLLNPSLPRDLETICLKCLEKEPSRRYPSARELGDELGRFLRNEPTVARPLGSAERLMRWCRRQPAIASLTATVALLLVGLALGASVAAWRIEAARRAEHHEREKALQANRRLSESVSFLELQRAEAFFRSGDASMGLAHLASVLRRDSSNRVAAARIMSALLDRNWVLPAGAPLQHSGFVFAVSFSPSGQYLVSGAADNFARVWDARTRKEIVRLPHPDHVRGVCFRPDETQIATAGGDGYARIWNWRSAELAGGPLKHDRFLMSVSFSPDGERIATACGDATATVWSARTGEALLRLAGHTDELRQSVFSPEGRLLATVSYDGTARLWNSRTGEAVGPVLRHSGRVLGAAFSPDGARLVTSSRDHTAVVWNIDLGAPALPPFQHPDGLNEVQFDPTGRIIVTTGFDNTVRLWDAQSGELVSQAFRHLEQVNQASFSPDGRILATAAEDWLVKFWAVQSGQVLEEPMRHAGASGEVNWVEFSPDGSLVNTASSDSTARVWDGNTGYPVSAPLQHAAPVQNACFSPDGRFILTAAADGSAWMWEARTGRRVKGPFKHAASISFVSFSPDGKRLVTASIDHSARVWDIESEKPITPPLKHNDGMVIARFSPEGTRVVTASRDNTVRVWNAADGVPLTRNLVHGDKLRDACFSPDGRRVATASMDNTARIWDARRGEPIGRVLQHVRTVETIAFSPDGVRVLTASLDHTARVWDATTGEALTPPLEHDEGVTYAAFSPDGQRVATASMDRTARIWDAKTGLPLSEPLRHKGPVRMAQFSPDGQRLVTATLSPESAARIWQVPAAPSRVPDWLPALAEAVAGMAVGAQGTTRLISENDFEQLRQRVNGLSDNDTFSLVARWFFADRTTRTISPFQSGTVAEYVQRRIAENTRASLEEAVRLDPTNGVALARLAKAVIPSDPGKEPRRAAEAAHLARRALRFAPDLPEAREVLERVSRQADRTDRRID